MSEQMNLESVTKEIKSLVKRASRERSGAFDGSYKLTIDQGRSWRKHPIRAGSGWPAG